MIVYGTQIISDIDIPLHLTAQKDLRYALHLNVMTYDAFKDETPREIASYTVHGRTVRFGSDREFTESVPGQPWSYIVEGVVRFFWYGGEKKIYYALEKEGGPALLGFWLVHLLLPFYFTLEGMYDILHAGAVEAEERAILFMAPSMGGKSTMTDYFLRRGHKLISDDKVATFVENGRFMLTPSHAYHRPYRRAETLGESTEHAATGFREIHAIFSLKAVEADAPVSIEEVGGFSKFHAVLPNHLYTFPFLRKRRLQCLTEMLNGLKVFEVSLPWNIERLSEIYEEIVQMQ